MPVENITDLILCLVYAPGNTAKPNEQIFGITRLEKFLYLLQQETEFSKIMNNEIDFQPSNFGPFASEIYDIVESLIEYELIEEKKIKIEQGDSDDFDLDSIEGEIAEDFRPNKTMKIYELTERGQKIAKKLYSELNEGEREILQNLKISYNRKPLIYLLRYVYKNYPESTINSAKKPELTNIQQHLKK